MLEAVSQSQINSIPLAQVTNIPDNCRDVIKIAVHAIRALGAILVAAGIGCLIASLQVPAITLLISGAAAIIFGFVLDKCSKSEGAKPILPATGSENTKDGLTSELGESGKADSILQPQMLEREINNNSPAQIEEVSFRLPENPEVQPALQLEILEEVIPNNPPPAIAFGKQEWIQYVGHDPGEMPPLPANIDEILAEPCRVWKGKTVAQTHMLVLVSKGLTLSSFDKLVSNTSRSLMIRPRREILERYGDAAAENAHWVLMTKDVLPETKGKIYADQERIVAAKGYAVPTCLDAAACIFLENMRSKTKYFKTSFTYCQEFCPGDLWKDLDIMVVGGFEPLSLGEGGILMIEWRNKVRDDFGMAGMKRL